MNWQGKKLRFCFLELDAFQLKTHKVIEKALRERSEDISETIAVEISAFLCVTPGTASKRSQPMELSCAALTKDNMSLIAGKMDGKIQIWDVESWKLLKEWEAHDRAPGVVHCDASGKIVASQSMNDLKIWNVEGKCLQTFVTWHISNCALSNDGSRVVARKEDDVLVWDVKSGDIIFNLNCKGLGFAFAEDDSLIFVGSGGIIIGRDYDTTVKIFETTNGTQVASLEGHKNTVSCCCPSQDGKLLLTTSADCTMLWDLEKRDVILTLDRQHEDIVSGCCLSSDGKTAVTIYRKSAWSDRYIYVWDLKTGQVRHKMQGNAWWCLITNNDEFMISDGMSGMDVFTLKTCKRH